MNLKELADLTDYLDTAMSMRQKKVEFLRIRGTNLIDILPIAKARGF
ncbi:hypothetical protein KVE41_02705 [Helicobacter pylori]|nr:hypothetical protein KVE41_02705 [Helicobacter pylori]